MMVERISSTLIYVQMPILYPEPKKKSFGDFQEFCWILHRWLQQFFDGKSHRIYYIICIQRAENSKQGRFKIKGENFGVTSNQ